MTQAARLNYLDVLRGFAIILVVGTHAYGYTVPEPSRGSTAFQQSLMEIPGIAVPLFFLVDGFLSVRSQNRLVPPGLREVVVKSARRLLVPWVIFNIIYVGLRALFESRGMFDKNMVIGQPLMVIASHIYRSEIAMQLYFLPTLFLMRLTVVPLRPVFRGPVWAILATWLGYCVAVKLLGIVLDSDPVSNALVGFRYFLFGALISRLEIWNLKRSLQIFLVAGVLGLMLKYVPVPLSMQYVANEAARYGFILLCYLGSMWVARYPTPLLWLGHHTMQIYLLHAPVLMKIVQIVVNKVTPLSGARYAGIWVGSLLLSVVLTAVLAKIPASRKLFGEA